MTSAVQSLYLDYFYGGGISTLIEGGADVPGKFMNLIQNQVIEVGFF